MKLFNPIMLIFYANAVMAMILDVDPMILPRKKQALWLGYTAAVVTVSVVFMLTVGQPTYGRLYVFLVQLPLYVEFLLLSRYRGVKVLFALLSTVVFASPPFMCAAALRTFCRVGFAATLMVYLLGYVAVVMITLRFLKADFNYMLEHGDSAQFWMFCAIPILHYIYVFSKTKYNFTQVNQAEGFWFGQLPTIIVLVSYVLLIRIFRSVRETQRLQNEAAMSHVQMEAATLRLRELNRAQEQTRRYRHDMRHHLTLLQTLAVEGDMPRIQEYLHTAQSDLEAVTPVRYCENETASLLLSSFDARARQMGVTLKVDAKLPESLPLSETELCGLLSNSLENAITAASQVSENVEKIVVLRATIYQEKLLLSVENPYTGEVPMKDGLPQASRAGHGYGVRSIAAIAEAHGGQTLFTPKDGVFTLKVMLPMYLVP